MNIALNLLTVPFIGALGAAAATLVSYWVTWFMRVRKLKSYMRIRINITRDYVSYALLVLQAVLFFAPLSLVAVHSCEAALVVIIVILYRREVFVALRKGRSVVKKGN